MLGRGVKTPKSTSLQGVLIHTQRNMTGLGASVLPPGLSVSAMLKGSALFYFPLVKTTPPQRLMSGCSASSVLPLGCTRIWVPASRDFSSRCLGVMVLLVLQLKSSSCCPALFGQPGKWRGERDGWFGEHPQSTMSCVLHPNPSVRILHWTRALESTALLCAPPCTPEHPRAP